MFIGRGLDSLSSNSIPSDEKVLIISENEFRSLESLSFLTDLEEIIADNNYIDERIQIPKLPKLRTLSLNKNKIKNIDILLDELSEKVPNLTLLSLLGNPVSPDPIYRHLDKLSRASVDIHDDNFRTLKLSDVEEADETGGDGDDDDDEYQRFRLKILYRLPLLQFLDSSMVTDVERKEAKRRGQFLQKKITETQTEKKSGFSNNGTGSVAQNRVADWISSFSPLKDTSEEEVLTPLGEPSKRKTPKIYYGKNQYAYKGRYSEGNRFIKNYDL